MATLGLHILGVIIALFALYWIASILFGILLVAVGALGVAFVGIVMFFLAPIRSTARLVARIRSRRS